MRASLSVQASAEAEKDDYVFDLALSRDEQRLWCSLSSMCLGVHDISEELKRITCIKAHSGRINCIESSEDSPHTLLSGAEECGQEGIDAHHGFRIWRTVRRSSCKVFVSVGWR